MTNVESISFPDVNLKLRLEKYLKEKKNLDILTPPKQEKNSDKQIYEIKTRAPIKEE